MRGRSAAGGASRRSLRSPVEAVRPYICGSLRSQNLHPAKNSKNHGLGGQTASKVIFDLRIELLDLKNHKTDTHIVTNKRPWPPRSEVMTSEVEAVIS